MQFETLGDVYVAYQKYEKKREHKKAYQCLELILKEVPGEIKILEDIVTLSLFELNDPAKAKKWLIELKKIRSHWVDYLFLSRAEAQLTNILFARKYLLNARQLYNKKAFSKSKEDKDMFAEVEELIRYKEYVMHIPPKETVVKSHSADLDTNKKSIPRNQEPKDENTIDAKTMQKAIEEKKPVEKPVGALMPFYNLPITVDTVSKETLLSVSNSELSPLKEATLLIEYSYADLQSGFDELLCLNAVSGVEKYWYQIETMKKVLKQFHGRALLCDEVGLGKTIEAGLIMKEYILRGMVRNVLILTPSSLVSQWKEEMSVKFNIDFTTTDDDEFSKNPEEFWKQNFIIASINVAKSINNEALVAGRFYDLVVVDEAHHLRNRTTLSWQLVNQIKKRFILLLTATPVQNNLVELFNLITLLQPGQFKTEKEFKREYLKKGSLKETADKNKIRELLRDVMIRNMRSVIEMKLPKRFATTVRIAPTEREKEIYNRIYEYLRKHNFKKTLTNLILREAGSSPFAVKSTILKMPLHEGSQEIIDEIDGLKDVCKGNALMDILSKNPNEKKIIFTQFIKSMNYISGLLDADKIPYATFAGNMTMSEKDRAIERFRNETPVLVSTESGGEGRNIQFCNTIINFDLPWNPMRIEQRIGRLHRIGQTRDVFIFNLSIKDTIEDYIIEILDNKINMFEMIIGEIEPILGQLGEDRSFEDIIMELWMKSADTEHLKSEFENIGNELVNAKREYLKAKELDNELFGEDFET